MTYLFATTNEAKIKYYGGRLKEQGIDVVTPADLNLKLDIEENGKNPTENAIIKARAYSNATGMPAIALDEGLYLENLPENLQPGTHVRRVGGKRLTDEEMIEYYKGLVTEYGELGLLRGYYLKGLAFVYQDMCSTFECKDNVVFSNKQSTIINKGYPLGSIRIVPELNKFKSELTDEEKKQIVDNSGQEIFNFLLNSIVAFEEEKEELRR